VSLGNRHSQHIAGGTGQADRRSPGARHLRRPPLIRRRAPTLVGAGPNVVDDFPAAIPVTRRELEVIETYLGALLDETLEKTE
jgi:hypothetical protein